MNPNGPQNPMTPEQIKAKMDFEKSLLEQHTMVFTKKQLVVIFNVLCRLEFKYADMVEIAPIIKKIEPIVAVDTNIPRTDTEVKQGNPVVLGGNKLKN